MKHLAALTCGLIHRILKKTIRTTIRTSISSPQVEGEAQLKFNQQYFRVKADY
ncbi:hypothetical protein [Asticcacaulis benevestitus]|uniref:hypothetical protein n=1 Tax=Asticcacaulis benevestitus TaxID=347481 RepID=UPI000A6C171F|nr:hypothetical protein [Asticcacaulis benevestitus]